MVNAVFLDVFTSQEQYQKSNSIQLPLESFITYCIYKCCVPKITLNLVPLSQTANESTVAISEDNLNFVDNEKVPWQVASCVYPVVMYEDTIITGLCAVARHICKYRSLPGSPEEHEEGLLGFRKGCLQAPNEVSIWTKFCEVELVGTVKQVLTGEKLIELPKNLVRFENHLKKPIRVHNVYKIARELKKEDVKSSKEKQITHEKDRSSNGNDDNNRVPKTRKWKSNIKKDIEIKSSVKIEDLNIQHQYAEGPFLTLADLILVPLYHILVQAFGNNTFKSLLPLTHKWFQNVTSLPELEHLMKLLQKLEINQMDLNNIAVPTMDDVSLYKCDPKRHNPKKRLFTKEVDIENALSCITEGMELSASKNESDYSINWNDIPNGANPNAGHLPDERVVRKSQQLENLAVAALKVAKEGDLIVDFCSGSGHLGILVGHLLPNCTVILLENKEQSLLRARARVHEMGLTNILFFQCNLDFFIGKFDIGLALHACGIASDLVLDKCLKANAKFVLCPCCYGSLHATDRLVYPRSGKFCGVTIDQYLCIGHAADQTHEEHPLTVRGAKCMEVIDSDRAHLAEEFGYKVTLSKLKPLSCTPKNNLLVGVPS